MPIYEYQCASCGHKLEALQKVSDVPLSLCPACQEEKLIKLISAASFRLKGGGWYETDFKDKNRKQLADAEPPGKTDKPSVDSNAKSGEGKSSDAVKDTKSVAKPNSASSKSDLSSP